jgi:mannose-1-phosphate guanylyltransferase
MPFYALIMAGGTGTRLWPRSRKDRPKQLLDIVSERTMLQETYERIRPLIPDEQIFVVTNDGYVDIVRQQLPALSEGYIIGEPEGHGTAPCIGLAALYLRRLDPSGVMAVLPADHLIRAGATFRRALQAAAQVAESGHLVTLGIQPTHPETGYGYIQRGDDLLQYAGEYDAYRVRRFTEKPDRETAEAFLANGGYYWNSGMFIWRVSAILREIERLMPELYAQLMEIDRALGTSQERAVLERVWAKVEDQTIDFGVMERAEDVAVIPVDIGWSDVGSWATLFQLLPSDENSNVVIGEHFGIETSDTLIYSPRRLIATVGVKDLVIVDTDDALLVCPRERAQEVKALVDALKRDNKHKYL